MDEEIELKTVDGRSVWVPLSGALRAVEQAIAEDGRPLVDLGFCIGSECIRTHGVRVATWRGIGPCSIYIVCDECHAERLTAEERKHMIEVRGADWVRHLGLHELHNGRLRDAEPTPDDRAATLARAIRLITVETPKKETEALRERLANAILGVVESNLPREVIADRIVAAVFMAADKLDASLGTQREALRIAAEAYFGGDFSKPDASTAPTGSPPEAPVAQKEMAS